MDPVVECPYDSYHKVSQNILQKHLAKCQKNYKISALRKGEDIDVFICKYNHEHKKLAPELLFHEERCPDRNFKHPHQLQPAVAALMDAEIWTLDVDLSAFQEDDRELAQKKTFGGINLESLSGRDSATRRIPLKSLRFPSSSAETGEKQAGEDEDKHEPKPTLAVNFDHMLSKRLAKTGNPQQHISSQSLDQVVQPHGIKDLVSSESSDEED